MTDSGTHRVALVAGGSGIVGHSVAMELKRQGWIVRALARRPIAEIETITVDLTNGDAIAAAVRPANDTTHLFYAALNPDPNLSVEAERNGQMLGNLLDGLTTVGAPLRRVVSYEGFKIYGIHLGANVRTPARESDPPHMPPNIYLSQRTQLRTRASSADWDNVALIPDVVVGDIFGNPMNIALVVGVFAELSRELGIPLRFPGTDTAYQQLVQFTDAGLLARASVWAATEEKASGEAFNVTNGDVFRWERMWEDIARHLGLDVAAPVPLKLAQHMADKGSVWKRIAERHDLVQPDLSKLVGWPFGDFIFHTETDVISDVNKINEFGFTERMDSAKSLIAAVDSLKRQRVLP
ncbi:SDR family oxidoreductase [Bradyrhizobium genosp. P]|uniref:SDR family oxidoreductase n=1 Tax=Bradyrhizobium genosp. P TaxID=83641 RepID=UPI003CF8E55C